jgi:hypothetical protein
MTVPPSRAGTLDVAVPKLRTGSETPSSEDAIAARFRSWHKEACMNNPEGLQIEALKPHLKAILDEVRRVGVTASGDARKLIDTELLERQRSEYEGDLAFDSAPSVAMSCAGLYTLSAVALQLYHDTKATDIDASTQYLLDAADYYLAAKAQGCNGHE